MMVTDTTKRCPRCREIKDLNSFGFSNGRVRGVCRTCNKIVCREYDLNRYATDPDFVERERQRSMRNRASRSYRVVQIFHTCKSSAKKRGIPFEISKDEIAQLIAKQNWTCIRTGVQFDLTTGAGKRPFGPTIDRIDSKKGYSADNIQLVCNIYNFAKNEFDDAVVLLFAASLLKAAGKEF